jgi:hypothetical protein
MKSQSSVIAIVLMVVVFVSISMFLMTTLISQQQPAQSKAARMNRLASNMLVSLLRTDTDCGPVSDMIKGVCGDCVSHCDCRGFVHNRITPYMDKMLNETGYTNLKYSVVIKPTAASCSGIVLGDPSANEKGAWSANSKLSIYNAELDVKIYIIES